MSGKRDLVTEATVAAKSLQLQEIHRIRDAWGHFDLNGDGVVQTTEVHQFLENLNIKIPDSEKARIEKELDRNGNGTIEFVEFVKNYEKGLFNSFKF